MIVFTSTALGAALPLFLSQLGVDPAHAGATIQVLLGCRFQIWEKNSIFFRIEPHQNFGCFCSESVRIEAFPALEHGFRSQEHTGTIVADSWSSRGNISKKDLKCTIIAITGSHFSRPHVFRLMDVSGVALTCAPRPQHQNLWHLWHCCSAEHLTFNDFNVC